MADFLMPALGADMTTGRVIQWLVQEGDPVKSGDVVAVVETHKGAIDVEIFLDGVIEHLAPLEQEFPVGAILAHVTQPGEQPGAAPKPATLPVAAPATQSSALLAAPSIMRAEALGSGQRISPAARRAAEALGVPLATLQGTGEGGAVTLQDVEREVAQRASMAENTATAAKATRARGFDPAKMREAIAAAMTRSKREIPHYYLTDDIDFAAANAWLEAWNRDRPPERRMLAAALLLKATAKALHASPQFNGLFENGVFRAGSGIHIGWAVSMRGGGLVAPAIHNVDQLALPDLMDTLRDLVQRARAGQLRSSELTDPTITVTSLGERGAEGVLGVIYPPQVAIVGFGRIRLFPCVVDGQIVPRPIASVSLAADHRVTDGHLGGQLLASINKALQEPQSL